MSILKQVAVALVAILMVVSVAGASAAFAVNGTILDSDHVTGSFDDAGVYESVATEGQDRIVEELDTALEGRTDEIPAGITLDVDNRAAAEAALTEEYVAGEFSTNVEQLLAYLKGDADELALQVDLVPVKDSLGAYVENDTITVDTVALANERGVNVTTAGVTVDSEMLVRLNEDRVGYEGARVQLRTQAVEGADVPVSIDANGSVVVETETFLEETDFAAERNGIRVDTAMLVRMNANQSGYDDARADIREQGLAEAGIPLEVAEDGSVVVDTVDISREVNFSSGREDVAIDDGMIARLNENQSGYDDVRTEIRTQAVEEFPVTVDENGEVVVDTVDIAQESNVTSDQSGVTVDDGMIERLNQNQSGYDDTRAEIRAQAVEEFPVTVDENGDVVVETVDVAQEIDFASASDRIDVTDDMIVRMNEGTDGYAAVRSDIREQVRAGLPPMATSAQVDTALEEINTELKANATSQARADYGENVSEETLDDIIALQDTVIDGLTDPDLEDYDAYATRRDDNEAALADSFDRELDDALREANADLKADAVEQARAEYGDDLESGTVENIVALQNTTIDGLTDPDLTDFEEYATRRDADEAALAESFDQELDDGLREANAEIKADAAEQARTEYGEDLSEGTMADVIALQNTTVDGLTDPDLTDFEEYATRRDADEAALEESLTAELEDRLRDANAEIKAEAAEQARADYGEDLSEGTMADVIALQNTVIDGLTHPDLTEYDDYASQRDDAEAALAESFDDELTTRLEEAGADVKADAADRIRNEYGDQLSEGTVEDVIALQDTVVDGLTRSDLSYDEYASQREDAEAGLEASLAAELRERIDDQVDDRIELGNVTGEQADALNTARTGVGLLGTLALVLPLVFLALIGVVYLITRSVHRTVATTGYSLLVAGIVGAAVGFLARDPVLDLVDTALESAGDELDGTGVTEAIQSIIDGLFATLTMQSVVLAIVGVVLVVVVFADRRGAFETLKARAGRGS